MNKKVNLFISLASGELELYRQEITGIVQRSLGYIGDNLPVPLNNLDIVVYDNRTGVVPEFGIGGLTPTANLLIITLDPNSKHFDQTLQLHFPKFLAHETHHILRKRELGRGRTLLDVLVFEGLADSFSNELFPGITYPWCKALTSEEFNVLLVKAKKELGLRENIRLKWLLGRADKRIPRWAGYTIGFQVIQKYIEIHGGTAANLYNTPSEEFRSIFNQI